MQGLTLAVVVALAAPQAHDGPPPAVEVVDRTLYLVEVDDGTGSGFLYRDDRTVVTNRHVVETVDVGGRLKLRPIVRRDDGFTDLGMPRPATLRFKHPDLDVAVIELANSAGTLPLLPHPDAQKRYLPRGTPLLVHGFPSTLSPTLSVGVLSGHFRDLTDGTTYYLTDAAMASGSSGGPVTDRNGRLIGMAAAVYDQTDEFGFEWGFVIPVREIDAIFIGPGGADDLPRPIEVDGLVAAVLAADTNVARMMAFNRGTDTIVNDSGSLQELADRLDAFVGRTRDTLAVDTPTELRQFVEMVLDLSARLTGRGLTLGLRDESDDDLVLAQLTDTGSRLGGWVGEVVDAALDGRETWQRSALLAAMLDVLADRSHRSIERAEDACGFLGAIDFDNDLELRALDNEVLVSSLVDLFRAGLIMKMSESMLESYGSLRAAQSVTLRDRLEDLRNASAEAQQRWGDMTPQCVELYHLFLGDDDSYMELDGEIAEWATAGDILQIRAEAGGRGLELIDTDVIDLDAEEELVFAIDFEAESAVVAAVSADRTDVDLVLRSPDGGVLDEDYERDHMPVTAVEGIRNGTYEIALQNTTSRRCRVVILVFVRP